MMKTLKIIVPLLCLSAAALIPARAQNMLPPAAAPGAPGTTASPATTLEQAFAAAYGDSPTLRADREGLKILDEDVAAARSQGRPVIQGEGSLTRAEMDVQGTGYIVGARVTQPLFRGFRVRNNIKAAQTNVQAGRESLRQSEIDTFRDIAGQYSAVLRDREIMALTQTMIDNLGTILKAEQRRLELGERTRTDVAQSEARLASADAAYATAVQRLAESETRFRSLAGFVPGGLAPLPPLPQLPASRDQAVDLALQFSPRIRQKKLEAQVADYQLAAAKGALAPQVDLIASINHRDEIVEILGRKLRQDLATFQATVTVPLYQGGAEYAAIRRARHTKNVRMIEIEEETRAVYADAAVAWDRFAAAQRSRESLGRAIVASETALNGVKREALAGSRTTLDILDAEAELRDARASYANAVHDEYAAKFGLLSAIGTATAADFNLEITPYDPDIHYRSAEDRWIGFGP